MRICFVGHAFHRRTRSSKFFVDILRQFGEVVELYADPDASPLANDAVIRAVMNARCDRYVFWQSEWLAEQIPVDLGTSFIVPMFDAVQGRTAEYWSMFVKYRFITFCRALHETLQAAGCATSYFQYFPDVPVDTPTREGDEDAGTAFFWERRPAGPISLPRVERQCRLLGIRALHLHAAADVEADRVSRESGTVDGLTISVSRWMEDRGAFDALASRPLFFFAPRPLEGIGMATLEAMARGQIVVAPDLPTTNEYVAHLVSGFLYDPRSPLDAADLPCLDRAALGRMSRAARRKSAQGRKTWLKDVDRMRSLILDDGQRWPTTDYSSRFAREIRRAAHRAAIDA